MNLLVYFQLSCLYALQALSKHSQVVSDGSCPGKGYEEQPFLKDYCSGNGKLNRFMTTVDALISSDCNLVDACRRILDRPDDVDREIVDFIVVGAGAAGPVVADRLSDNPAWKVVLLEAGPEQPAATDIPAFLSTGIGTRYDWKYVTAPQRNACLLTGGVCEWPRGKVLGGTVALSGSMYSRGHRQIYDSWAQSGNTGWAYDDVLPVFKMSEKNRNFNSGEHSRLHGAEGPIPVMLPREVVPITKSIVEAGKQLGYRQIDMSEPEPFGFSLAQAMTNDLEIRETVPTSYIRPHLHRDNLKVRINRHVTKLLVDPDTKAVYGVEYVDTNDTGNKTYKLIARKEVILSGGIVGSTQLLLTAGIGPEDDLKRLGIPVVQNLNVGRNLQHHVAVKLTFHLNVTNSKVLSYESVFRYLKNKSGSLSTTGALQASAFLKSDQVNGSQPADVQLFFDGFVPTCENAQPRFGCPKPHNPAKLAIRAVNLRPRSRGTIKLNSPDPFDRPVIDPNYLTVDTDLEVLLWGIKVIKELADTKALQSYGAKLDRTPVRECRHHKFDTDPYWRCYIRFYSTGENHHAGTSKMGPASDPEAVVDDRLRVHRVKGIRVVDASIMPLQPNCNPIAPTVMIAEKAAMFIKDFWKS